MAAKRIRICFDALPIRSRDTSLRWRTFQSPIVSHKRPQKRQLATEAHPSIGIPDPEVVVPSVNKAGSLTTRVTPSHVQMPFPVISSVPSHIQPQTVTTTLYRFPTLEPLQFLEYPYNHLSLPLRKDLLHRAVVFEGDAARQGTAATKYKHEIHGSTRKLHPQKGTGRARAGSRKSPIRRGGGRAFAKKARDFSTGFPKKAYDIAWRTALSYRYQRGQLVVVDSFAVDEGLELAATPLRAQSWVEQVFPRLGWEKKGGGSLMLAALEKNEELMGKKMGIFTGLESARGWGIGLTVNDVDVKDLLKGERVVVEKRALDWMLQRHQSDLV